MHLEYFKNEILPLKNKLFRFAFSFLGDKAESEDVVQEVFIRLWEKRKGIDQIKNIEAWSMTMTRNMSLDKLKNRSRNHSDLKVLNESENSDPGPVQIVERSEIMEEIHSLIRNLSEKQRQVITLRDIEGYTYQEIGEIIGIDQNLVKVTLFRARENIRKKILKTDRYGL